MTERRYSDEEVAAIFERAAEAQASGPSPAPRAEGRTLAELRAIGEEVGIPGELVTRAARSLESAGLSTGRSFLGFPLAVGRTVELGRDLTEDEWERLVVDLRETFDARGRVRAHGSFREWTNGNLQALLEPTADGHRLRLRTVKGDARNLMTGGLTLIGIALVVLLALVLAGGPGAEWDASVVLALLGGGMFGAGALRLPGWAATRRAQMEEVAARAMLPPPDRGETGAGPPDGGASAGELDAGPPPR